MPEYVETKYYSFSDFLENSKKTGSKGQIAQMFLELYERVRKKEKPTILELGTNMGASTLIFLQACTENNGDVYSVDIGDYSDLTDKECWTFIQSESTDVTGIIKKHPALEKGIDVLMIDSLHKRYHVEKEFWGWAPYLNENALIIFDDVDPNIYRPGARKDNISHEFDWHEIRDFVEEVFYANEEDLFLEIHYGSTGFAIMTKRTSRSQPLKKEQTIKSRTGSAFWRLYMKIRNMLKTLKSS